MRVYSWCDQWPSRGPPPVPLDQKGENGGTLAHGGQGCPRVSRSVGPRWLALEAWGSGGLASASGPTATHPCVLGFLVWVF